MINKLARLRKYFMTYMCAINDGEILNRRGMSSDAISITETNGDGESVETILYNKALADAEIRDDGAILVDAEIVGDALDGECEVEHRKVKIEFFATQKVKVTPYDAFDADSHVFVIRDKEGEAKYELTIREQKGSLPRADVELDIIALEGDYQGSLYFTVSDQYDAGLAIVHDHIKESRSIHSEGTYYPECNNH